MRCPTCEIPGGADCLGERFPRLCVLVERGEPGIAGRLRALAGLDPPLVGLDPPPPTSQVVIRSIPCSWTGYGQIGHWLGLGLETLGIPVAYAPIGVDEHYYPLEDFERARRVGNFPSDWILQLATPGTAVIPGKRTVTFSMWEATRLRPDALDALNQSQAVIVPCQQNVAVFRDSGVTRPIHVVRCGVSAEEGYRPTVGPPADVCRFGAAGRMAHGGIRKGLREAIQAFRRALPTEADAALVVKVWPDCPLDAPDDPRVTIDRTPMRPAAMAAWYRGLTCYLTASKGEGFGLQPLQAMAVGRPVIGAAVGGHAEYLDETVGYPVGYDWRPAGEFYATPGAEWAVPREAELVAAIRSVYRDRATARAKGEAAARRAAEFTWQRTGRELRQVLVDVGVLAAKPRVPLGTPHCRPCVEEAAGR